MERLGNGEQEPALRPLLAVDLSSGDGLAFNLVTMAMQQVEGDELARLNQSVWMATQAGSGATYDDLLRIVNMHLDLVDISGTFPRYGQRGKVNEAVNRLQEQVGALPESMVSNICGLYPEFTNPDTGAEVYLRLLDIEIASVGQEIARNGGDKGAPLEKYRQMLRGCAASLRRYGVV